MYCVKCGVELADSEQVCPLCGTRVYHPDIVRETVDPPFPPSDGNDVKVSRKGIMFAVSVAFLAIIAQLFICRFTIPSSSKWVGYAIGGVALFYIAFVMPFWFRRPNPVVFVPCTYAAVLLYVLYISLSVKGKWFLPFAFPVIGASALITTAIVALLRYVPKGYLYIFGGGLIAHGTLTVLLEFLIGVNFLKDAKLRWSYFPLGACFILGMGLIIIAISKPLRESLKKKFFF